MSKLMLILKTFIIVIYELVKAISKDISDGLENDDLSTDNDFQVNPATDNGFRVNPATGLPMENSFVDIDGNSYGEG